jgi:hypothetical protein
MGDNVSEPLDRARAGRILPECNVSPYLVVIGGVFRNNSPKVFCVGHDQMIRALVPDRADQALSISILPRRAERRRPVPDPHRSYTCRCSKIRFGFRNGWQAKITTDDIDDILSVEDNVGHRL